MASAVRLHISGWEDGERVERTLETPDRWALHSADEVTVEVGDLAVRLKQQPSAIPASRIGVGACLWEGELLLAAHLAKMPRHRWYGARCVELGSGPGLVGVLLAQLGAHCIITDIAKVLPIIRGNVALNSVGPVPSTSCAGSAEVEELEWGKEGYMDTVKRLGATSVDWVLAADCCYVDQDGVSPSTPHFVAACKGLCSARTVVLVSFELRSGNVKATFLEEARKTFSQVKRVPRGSLPRGYQVDHIELYELRQ